MSVYDIHGLTTKGPVRQANEDHILVGRFIKSDGAVGVRIETDDEYLGVQGLVCAVADGVGGEAGGATASKLAIQSVDAQFYGVEKTGGLLGKCREALTAAGQRANQTLLSVQASRPALGRMGCTLSGVCLTSEGFLVFNAGDSRVYRLRDAILRQLTSDDSVAAMAVTSGAMSAGEAEVSETRHTIVNLVGSQSFKLQVTDGPEFRDGDALLVCTDGVHDLVPLEELESLLANAAEARLMAERVVEGAVARGGRDNISLVVVRKVAGAPPIAAEQAAAEAPPILKS